MPPANFKHHLSLPDSGWLRLLLKLSLGGIWEAPLGNHRSITSFPVDEKPIFPFFVDWAPQGGASKPRPSNFLSTGIVDWAGWYLVLSTGLAGSQHCVGSVGREIES